MSSSMMIQSLLWVVAAVAVFLFLRRRRARRSRESGSR
jgi:preprotein translocase subunit YajC